MKKNKVFFIITLSFFLFCCLPQIIAAEKIEKLSLKCIQKIEIYSSGKTKNVKLIILIPQDYKYRQKVKKIQFSFKPIRIFEDDNNYYAEFFFKKIGGYEEIYITIFLDIYRYDLDTAKNMNVQNRGITEKNIYKYLQSEQFIESDNKSIIAAAKNINAENKIVLINLLYDFLRSNIKFKIEEGKSGAVSALVNKEGNYSDYSYLFSALCRAKGIPARYVMGYFNFKPHAWTEIYLDDLGWIPFDPAFDGYKDSSFNILSNNYIYYSFKANDKKIYNTYGNCWWEGEAPIISGNTDIIKLK
ncbi:MAG: transglutaminase domain-containing protein [Spirochaetes bacterium]|nr:transglutaminase domain-containing protein [Spirochaetota bacterium]